MSLFISSASLSLEPMSSSSDPSPPSLSSCSCFYLSSSKSFICWAIYSSRLVKLLADINVGSKSCFLPLSSTAWLSARTASTSLADTSFTLLKMLLAFLSSSVISFVDPWPVLRLNVEEIFSLVTFLRVDVIWSPTLSWEIVSSPLTFILI